ncbi:hypothetical protein [Persephonella sp.]
MGIHLFIINPEASISVKQEMIIARNRVISQEIPLNLLSCTFVLNPERKRLPSRLYSKPIFWIDEKGNLSGIHLPSEGKKTIKNIDSFAFEILKESFFQVLSFIKRLKPREKRIASQSVFLKDIERTLLLKKNVDLLKAHDMIDLLFKDIIYPFLHIQRRYESSSFENVVFNYLHSLYIAYITLKLNEKEIDPQQDLPLGKKNYPGLTLFLFNVLKVHSSTVASDILENLLIKSEDFTRLPLKVSPVAKNIIAKVFAEKLIHNPVQIKKLDYLIDITLNHAD